MTDCKLSYTMKFSSTKLLVIVLFCMAKLLKFGTLQQWLVLTINNEFLKMESGDVKIQLDYSGTLGQLAGVALCLSCRHWNTGLGYVLFPLTLDNAESLDISEVSDVESVPFRVL